MRAYGDLFVFRAPKVTVRQLSSASPLSPVAAEANEAMVGGILAAMPYRTLLPNDACRDCVVPVSRGFLHDTTYGPQPIATPYARPFTTVFSSGASSVRQGTPTTKSPTPAVDKTIPSKACFPSTYVAAINLGACEAAPSRSFLREQIVRPLALLSGLAYAYYWHSTNYYSELDMYEPYEPPKGFLTLWDAYYYQPGGYGSGAGEFYNNPHSKTAFYAVPSTTWISETQVYYYDPQRLPMGGGQGIYATTISSGN